MAVIAFKPLVGTKSLFVTDSSESGALLSRRLSRAGACVVTVSNARDAFARSRLDEFDAVLTQVEMPQIDGYTLIEKLWQRGSLSPFIVISTSERDSKDDFDRSTMIAAQFCAVAEPWELVRVVMDLLPKLSLSLPDWIEAERSGTQSSELRGPSVDKER